jgi:hypothetical protein
MKGNKKIDELIFAEKEVSRSRKGSTDIESGRSRKGSSDYYQDKDDIRSTDFEMELLLKRLDKVEKSGRTLIESSYRQRYLLEVFRAFDDSVDAAGKAAPPPNSIVPKVIRTCFSSHSTDLKSQGVNSALLKKHCIF